VELHRLEARNLIDIEKRKSQEPQSAIVSGTFLELFELLEEYAPAWYNEGHRARAVAAVRILQKA
jgi:hypothetical protein